MSDDCRVKALCEFLTDDPASPLKRHTPVGADVDAVIDLRAVFQPYHRDVDVGNLHPLLMPQKGELGLRDYEKVYCPDLKSGRDIFDLRGIDHELGCMIIVRPDQYVADVLPIDDHAALSRFFAGVLRHMRRQDRWTGPAMSAAPAACGYRRGASVAGWCLLDRQGTAH